MIFMFWAASENSWVSVDKPLSSSSSSSALSTQQRHPFVKTVSSGQPSKTAPQIFHCIVYFPYQFKNGQCIHIANHAPSQTWVTTAQVTGTETISSPLILAIFYLFLFLFSPFRFPFSSLCLSFSFFFFFFYLPANFPQVSRFAVISRELGYQVPRFLQAWLWMH